VATATGATLLIATSAALGAYYGFIVGSAHGGAILGSLLAAAALGGELLKPFAVAAGIEALGQWRPARAVACLILGAVCVVYSLSAELGLAAAARGDLAAARKFEADAVARAAADYRRAAADLAALAPSRPAAEVKALIAGIDATSGIVVAGVPCGGIANGPTTKRLCPERVALVAELARADERIRLSGELAAASERQGKAGKKIEADPLAAAVATYAAAAGMPVKAEALLPWLALLPVLLLEVGSALGLFVVRAFEPATAMMAHAVAAPEPARAVQPAAVHQARTGMDQPSAPPNRDDVAAAVLRQVQAAGGRLNHSERGLAKLIGSSRSTTRRALNGLVSAGLLVAVTGAGGTQLRLVG
jgi:hypothetical protein